MKAKYLLLKLSSWRFWDSYMFFSKKKMYVHIKSIYMYDRESVHAMWVYIRTYVFATRLNMANSLSTSRDVPSNFRDVNSIFVKRGHDGCIFDWRPVRRYVRFVKTDSVSSTAEIVVAEPYFKVQRFDDLKSSLIYTVRLSFERMA